ncbi:hypothetical protein PSP6_470020 [Paraburkholderia tropica]|nr:hypothetical protein PSP6_470020 [Paraburkholderia tropica]
MCGSCAVRVIRAVFAGWMRRRAGRRRHARRGGIARAVGIGYRHRRARPVRRWYMRFAVAAASGRPWRASRAEALNPLRSRCAQAKLWSAVAGLAARARPSPGRRAIERASGGGTRQNKQQDNTVARRPGEPGRIHGSRRRPPQCADFSLSQSLAAAWPDHGCAVARLRRRGRRLPAGVVTKPPQRAGGRRKSRPAVRQAIYPRYGAKHWAKQRAKQREKYLRDSNKERT